MTKKCLYCGKEFETDTYSKVYCCGTCARASYYRNNYVPVIKGTTTKKCKNCGCEMVVNTYGRVPSYCSRSCKTKYNYLLKNPTGIGICLECGKEIVLHYNSNGETRNKFCSQKCGNSYSKRANKDREADNRNKPSRRYNVYFHSAQDRGIEFDITFEEFNTFWNKPCHYCGQSIEGVGIDRIDSSVGYNMDNCVSCCTRCNRMKLDLPVSDFLSHIQTIINHTAQVKSLDSSNS